MFRLNQLLRAANENGEGGGAGGGEGGEGGEQGAVDPAVLQAQIADLMKQNEAMRNKNSELLGETKRAKELRREAEQRATEEAEEKARKAGDFEQLHKSSRQENEKLKQQIQEMQQSTAKQIQKNTAMKLAAQLADGENAEILSDYISKRLKYTDDGVKVTDNNGELTVSTLEQLKDEFSSSTRFKSLLKGSQASGGGAQGGGNSSATSKVMTRSEFDNVNAGQKSEFIKSGGKVVD
ncbi:MAG TPA: hypothetical protein VIC51_03300 [Psychromonas sp.]